MSAFDRLLQPENLNYAWIKARNLYRTADGYIDAAEIAAFELDLERKLFEIHRQFERGTYRLKKLRPLPRPKKIEEEKPINRQYFHISIEDQVAWIALVNALGPELDLKMEPWSYGNRLYRPAWYEKHETSRSKLEIGPYRHASGHLYRKFQHSWPLFRRHVTLTARMMVLRRPLHKDEMDEADQLATIAAEDADLPYFKPGFWPQKNASNRSNDLFHASIDLEKFYPELNNKAVFRGLAEAGAMKDPRIANLVTRMLKFQIDITGMPDTALLNVDPPFQKSRVKGIPTGLFVAGFLANAAMLPVDQAVAQQIEKRRDIAHFRFVDDHTIIAYDFDALCNWIIWYENLLRKLDIGPKVNTKKYDPPSLNDWIAQLKSDLAENRTHEKEIDAYNLAKRETRLDGKNPTKLMTKTLAQVSAIAATDIHILDDEDLDERLKMLEWLLLADIPEREIRPDTRASFAAGQIASLVPVIIQEADGLAEAARALEVHKRRQPDATRATEDDLTQHSKTLNQLQKQLDATIALHNQEELILLKRCFDLLLQSLREHPGKARLFYRIHQYCQLTGHRGLKSILEWLEETRAEGREVWADYYSGLSLQIMARAVLQAMRRLEAPYSMRSEISASENYLRDIAGINSEAFRVKKERKTWFHAVAQREFGIALLQAAKILAQRAGYADLATRFTELSRLYTPEMSELLGDEQLIASDYTLGVWAHLAENILGTERSPSAAWLALVPDFSFKQRLDRLAARRYPEYLPDAGWAQLLNLTGAFPESDSAWLREVIGKDEKRRTEAHATRKAALLRAVRSLDSPPEHLITIDEWTKCVQSCSPFDPRRGEWTALEITAQLLEEAVPFGADDTVLDCLHPNNVLLPRRWISEYPCKSDWTELSWETWRDLVRDQEIKINKRKPRAQFRSGRTSLLDYRYAVSSTSGIPQPSEERRILSVGRLLLGLLRFDHAAPRIWNMRGNEHIYRLPRAQWFEKLAISSPTTLILESCLGSRPAESRVIARKPGLFGWHDGEPLRDDKFDPPPIFGTTDLLEAIRTAQKILEDNQLAVAWNQPRQLIPFRLEDFAAGDDSADDAVVEGGSDGE